MTDKDTWSEAYKSGVVKETPDSTTLPFLRISRNSVVLDIGCGRGTYLKGLAKKYGIKAIGIDIVPFKDREVDSVRADAAHLPFKEEVFDIVYSLGVVEHLPSTGAAIFDSFRVLKKGGQALFTVPNVFSLHSLLFRPISKMMGIWRLGPERSFRASELNEMLRDSGFLEIEQANIPWIIFDREPAIRKFLKRTDNALRVLFNSWGFFICIYGVKPS